jgi:hypothetical protein
MALTKVLTGGIALDAVDNTILKLDDDYALTGTVSGAGKIGQVIQTVKTDTTSTTSDTYAAISGMTASMACASTSSKVLVNVNIYVGRAANGYGSIQLWIGGSVSAFIGDASNSRPRTSLGNPISANSTVSLDSYSGSFLHSPSSTSSIAYALYWQDGTEGTTLYLNRTGTNNDNANGANGVSTITLMEIL